MYIRSKVVQDCDRDGKIQGTRASMHHAKSMYVRTTIP